MDKLDHFVSPRQAARALDVSESSLKRWCDAGEIDAVRTAGGHRKLSAAAVLRFARNHGYRVALPEVLGLPTRSGDAAEDSRSSRQRLAAVLAEGDEAGAMQLVFELFLSRQALCDILDQTVAGAFHEIGEQWACRQLSVYQERRACEICRRILVELRRTQPPPPSKLRAMGGTLSGDSYALPTAMVELVLREAGIDAVSLGASIPAESLIAAAHTRPALFWLSVSHFDEEAQFLGDFVPLADACRELCVPLVVGGRSLTDSLRQSMPNSVYCETLRDLDQIVQTFVRPAEACATPAATAGGQC